jgi:hypothetical protein
MIASSFLRDNVKATLVNCHKFWRYPKASFKIFQTKKDLGKHAHCMVKAIMKRLAFGHHPGGRAFKRTSSALCSL